MLASQKTVGADAHDTADAIDILASSRKVSFNDVRSKQHLLW